MAWQLKKFNDLTNSELYQILALRSAVFVVEQACAYQDIDDRDQDSLHLYLKEAGEIVAYARLLPLGSSFDDALSIGRVLVKETKRGQGLARDLLERAINTLEASFGQAPIRIHGQSYLKEFYESLGFVVTGEEFLEDGIPHLSMDLQKGQTIA